MARSALATAVALLVLPMSLTVSCTLSMDNIRSLVLTHLIEGFAGGHKVFLFNFKMPLDGNRGFNGDMPAIWALNGAIPRAAQYNACSCWPPCGEVDMFEVLAKGDTKCKSTFHLANGGGSSDYFDRPTDKFMKAAVVFDEDAAAVSIRVLPDDTDFSKGLDDQTVADWVTGNGASSSGGPKLLSSLFQIAGGLL